jgi:hypothetical protein
VPRVWEWLTYLPAVAVSFLFFGWIFFSKFGREYAAATPYRSAFTRVMMHITMPFFCGFFTWVMLYSAVTGGVGIYVRWVGVPTLEYGTITLKKYDVYKCGKQVSIQWQRGGFVDKYCGSKVWADSVTVGETVERTNWTRGSLVSKSYYAWPKKGISAETREAELIWQYLSLYLFGGAAVLALIAVCMKPFSLAYLSILLGSSLISFMNYSSI